MAGPAADIAAASPTIVPLGDSALLVRFGTSISDVANRAAIALARRLGDEPLPGVVEIVPNLVSVLLRYDSMAVEFSRLTGELRLRLYATDPHAAVPARRHRIVIAFGGTPGPDLEEVATSLGMSRQAFIAAHNAAPLRVLSMGFAPGFVYAGFHPEPLYLPRRPELRPSVPAGSVLFAAGQTAITATAIPTGWHVIGHTAFSNFDPLSAPPTRLRAGDEIVFEAAP